MAYFVALHQEARPERVEQLLDAIRASLAAFAFPQNLIVAWRLFRRAGAVTGLLGRNGLRASSKVMSLLLAAIAIQTMAEGARRLFPGLAS